MAEINLDAARKARAEVKGEKHVVRFGGKRFNLPPELPMEFAIALSEGRVKDALVAVLDGSYEDFWKLEPSMGDYAALTEGIASLYMGVPAPNSPGSADSSSSGSSS